MAGNAVSLVNEFMSNLGTTNEENAAAYAKYLAEDVVWDTGSRVLNGREACVAHVRNLPVEYEVGSTVVRMRNIAGDDRIALTERVDDLLAPDGTFLMGSRVMGVFEVADGQVVAWRDYYDTASLGQELAEAKAARA